MGELVIFENELNKLQLGNLSKASMNIFMALCYKMKKQGDKKIKMSFSEIKELAGYKHNGDAAKNFIVDLDNMTDQLLAVNSKIIEKNPSGKKKIYKFDLFPTWILDEEEQTLEVGVNADFQWLLNEFNHYTSLDLGEIVSFKSKYTKNLFRLIRQWKSLGELTVGEGGQESSIEDFRKKIGVKDSYTNKEMLRSCIDVAVKEINNTPDCSIKNLSYEKKYANRQGKPLSKIVFRWDKVKGNEKKELEDTSLDSIYVTIEDLLRDRKEYSKDDINAIAKAAKKNKIKDSQVRERVQYVLQKENVKNPVGYMIALMGKFNTVHEAKEKLKGFNDFNQREYDYDELMNDILGLKKEKEEPIEKLSKVVQKKEEKEEDFPFELSYSDNSVESKIKDLPKERIQEILDMLKSIPG